MNWDERKTMKNARTLLAGARKLMRMNRDILDARRVDEVTALCTDLDEAIAKKLTEAVGPLTEKLERVLERVLPRPKDASIRENVEVLLVAVIVAMAVRSFFFQPFKIPTGSMQPTLYGVYPQTTENPTRYPDGKSPSIVAKILGTIFTGTMYEADGYRTRGDHIFVDRFTYHFRKPRRGEVIVFDTAHIPDIPESSRGKFYIKRLIGLEDDVIRIDPPHVRVNGDVLDSRPAFERIYSKASGYSGYVLPGGFPGPKFLRSSLDTYRVPPKHLFVLGDNSPSSLDGRFWGSLPKKDLVGRAAFVYWPFTRRFGLID